MAVATKLLLLADNPGREYVARIQTGASRFAARTSFDLAMENVYDSKRRLEDILADDTIAGIILTPPFSDDRHALLAIKAKRLPYIRIAPLLDPDRGSSVVMDEFEAAETVVKVMLEKGHRRIAHMRGPSSHLVSMRRYNGYTSALGTKSISVDKNLVVQGDFTRETARELAPRLFAMRPTAIFAANDAMALGILDAAQKAGLSVPGNLSLVGYDDNPGAKTCRPGLTTVRQPLGRMGESACRLLVERVKNPALCNETVTEPYAIIERGSVAQVSESQAA
ncbi:substrate-binding domain-containing protein [Qipengyuania flava]|uniref:substrate-binding domain-containing protein n=1 Tax=Qipengyuania flava TaxID=192812 RepID=UPI001C624BE2|nr:substrate-binding domain-containing protein [Qipengyuania flava]QYJ08263.1 substrate-binding domain-containing protein [Qipengyuania flava]